MSSEPRHRQTNETMSECIAQYPGELDIDAVGMFQIVPGGRVDFGLAGDELTDYVRRAILALLDEGAVPVRGAPGSGYFWIHQKHYGTSREDIADAVIAEWLSLEDDPMVLVGAAWFARPRPDSPDYVKMD